MRVHCPTCKRAVRTEMTMNFIRGETSHLVTCHFCKKMWTVRQKRKPVMKRLLITLIVAAFAGGMYWGST